MVEETFLSLPSRILAGGITAYNRLSIEHVNSLCRLPTSAAGQMNHRRSHSLNAKERSPRGVKKNSELSERLDWACGRNGSWVKGMRGLGEWKWTGIAFQKECMRRVQKREAAGICTHTCREEDSGQDGVTLAWIHMTVGTLSMNACDLGLVSSILQASVS